MTETRRQRRRIKLRVMSGIPDHVAHENRACAVVWVVVLVLGLGAPAVSQERQPTVVVSGDVATPLELPAADLAGMSRATDEVEEDGGTKACQGVWLDEILAKAGAPSGEAIRGKALAGYALATARDGYQVVFGLAELDPLFRDDRVVLFDQAGGKPLFPYQGPFRLIVPGDKRGARSIRMLERIEIVQLRK